MRMNEALSVMAVGFRPKGYMVAFEHLEGRILRGDHFPDCRAGETPIASEELAWVMAYAFAQKTTGKCVNIYVVDDSFSPVKDYHERKIENR